MAIADIIAAARREKRTVLTEVEAKEVVRGVGVPVVETHLATTKREAAARAKALGYPVVVKIVSPDLTHKSDIGGVKMNLQSARQVEAAWDQVMEAARWANPSATILGVSVQKMAPPGTEVIIGGTKDPQFGPVLMFGLGAFLLRC